MAYDLWPLEWTNRCTQLAWSMARDRGGFDEEDYLRLMGLLAVQGIPLEAARLPIFVSHVLDQAGIVIGRAPDLIPTRASTSPPPINWPGVGQSLPGPAGYGQTGPGATGYPATPGYGAVPLPSGTNLPGDGWAPPASGTTTGWETLLPPVSSSTPAAVSRESAVPEPVPSPKPDSATEPSTKPDSTSEALGLTGEPDLTDWPTSASSASELLTAVDLHDARFHIARRNGYMVDEVDHFVERAEVTAAAWAERLAWIRNGRKGPPPAEPTANDLVTLDEAQRTRFHISRRNGYDVVEVDQLLDRIEGLLTALADEPE